MVEIILGIWLVCFILSLVIVGVNFQITSKRLNSKKLGILNSNLEKAGLHWSNTLGDFAPLLPGSIQDDRTKSLRNVLLTGLLGLASVPGLLLLALVVLSSHKLARSRKETATFLDVIAKESSLDSDSVKQRVSDLNQIF